MVAGLALGHAYMGRRHVDEVHTMIHGLLWPHSMMHVPQQKAPTAVVDVRAVYLHARRWVAAQYLIAAGADAHGAGCRKWGFVAYHPLTAGIATPAIKRGPMQAATWCWNSWQRHAVSSMQCAAR